MKKFYVGILVASIGREMFQAEATPTTESHGTKYAAVIGPFKTKRGAAYMKQFGQSNPHCQTVSQAEALGKKYADCYNAKTSEYNIIAEARYTTTPAAVANKLHRNRQSHAIMGLGAI
jgi:hypothetical protein